MNIQKYWLKNGDIFNIHTNNNDMNKVEYVVDSVGTKLPKPCFSDKILYNMNDYYKLKNFKYTKKDLLSTIDFHKLKIQGISKMKRDTINDYLFNYMRLSYYTKKIQKVWSKYMISLYNGLLGPAYRNYEISNNVEDFLTTEKIKDIDYELFFSFRDDDNFVYTFNLISLHNLLTKSMKYNPYNRKPFSDVVMKNIKLKAKINSILARNHRDMYDKYTKKMIEIVKPSTPVRRSTSTTVSMSSRDIINAIRDIFIVIDGYGNYTQCEWFLSLNPRQCRRFIYELKDVWFYRAQIPSSTRIMIYPPTGNPFYDISTNMNHNLPIDVYREKSINVMNRILHTSSNEEFKKLGALYILTALTIVSPQAANALPWLYASTQ